MNLDIVLNTQEDVHSPENQKSLASAFLEVETNEMKKHRTLATFLYNTKIDERNNEKNFNKSQSKETFNNTEVQYWSTVVLVKSYKFLVESVHYILFS